MSAGAPVTATPPSSPAAPDAAAAAARALARRHRAQGWWCLVVFVALGTVLEVLHGLKAGFYLDPAHATRRLLWTLAHAHGTLLGVLHLAFASTVAATGSWRARPRAVASACLSAAAVLLPLGFFAAGALPYAGDPGLAVALVPPGGLLLLVAVTLTAVAATTARD